MQALKYQLFGYLFCLFDDCLNRQVLIAKFFRFDQLEALQKNIFFGVCSCNVLLKVIEDGHSQPYCSEIPFDYYEVHEIFDVRDWERIDEECDKPLKNPNLVGKVGRFQVLVGLWADLFGDSPEKFAIEPAEGKLILIEPDKH